MAYVVWHWSVAGLRVSQWLSSDAVRRWMIRNPFGLAPTGSDVWFGRFHAASGTALALLAVGGWIVFLGSAGRRSGRWVFPARLVQTFIILLLASSAVSGWMAFAGVTGYPHRLAATLTYAALAAHVGAAIVHAVLIRDGVIARVLPPKPRS